ncbi:DacB [Desulfamplus magnetovallimortis]|uniref:DacB n=1 Tax=Desulfamplus magnetovallimortis TaxID=1246637 RepID=A0A1W1HKK3_9BACT|nr:D-alanyl-D-alanine carboxypeptidase [Desulfamplus magnetovallimortis]SLM32966.1 DacB [Desulfamplus magnetovallimortis]
MITNIVLKMSRIIMLLMIFGTITIYPQWYYKYANYLAHSASSIKSKLNTHSKNPNIGIMLCDPNGTILFSGNAAKTYIPASTIKVLTSLAAIHFLGENYRFQTRFYLGNNDILIIKGYGDPMLVSERLVSLCHEVALKLKSMNILQINGILLDDGYFASDIIIDGNGNSNNPYDAFTGALCANFNSVAFNFDKSTNRYVTAEAQTPLLPFALERVKASGMKKGRVIFSREESRLYAGRLIRHFLLKEGIEVKDNISYNENILKTVNKSETDQKNIKNDKEIKNKKEIKSNIEHNSKNNNFIQNEVYNYISELTLLEIIKNLLKYSNNFIANQILLTSGAAQYSPPATIEKGVAAITAYASEVVGLKNFKAYEGSGLSRKNSISPADMVKVLEKFKPYYTLMPFEKREHSYTAKSNTRKFEYREYYKTGTLYKVRTRCGYFETPNGLYPFVIMINQKGTGYEAIKEMLWETIMEYEDQKFFD